MTFGALIRRNVGWYWRTNLAVVAGVAVAVAVLAGALLVGASVRSSLRALALERLGSVDHVVTSFGYVRESLADDLLASEALAAGFEAAAPLVAIEGFVTHQASRSRASAVQVYGVDERFWTFHGRDPAQFDLPRNTAFISEGLAGELGAAPDDALLVRVERPSDVPLSSLHGRRDDVGRTLRLSIARVLPPAELGEFSFRPQQGLARSVFVPLAALQAEIEQETRVNTLLLRADGGSEVDPAAQVSAVEAALREQTTLADLGLRVRIIAAHGQLSVESEAGLLDAEVETAAGRAAAAAGLRAEPVLTYLANRISSGARVTPYSLVAALDPALVSPAAGGQSAPAGGPIPVVLNDWIAADLDVGPGDPLEMEYYLWEDEGRLVTRNAALQVADVVPLAGAADDRDLAPEYRGMTDAENVIDWDPPFDVDLSLIRPADEDYWDDHRTTPKAFIPLAAGQQLWESRWGRLTSLRAAPPAGGDLDAARGELAAALRAELDPLALGLVVYPARALAVEASAGATDFGLYFIYFSFFLVVSALLLASLFFRLGVEQRLRELGLLRAAGFSGRAVRRVFLSEGLVLSVAGSVLGIAGAVAYAWLIMWGLRTWWVDAVGTTRLVLDVSPLMLAAGGAGGVLAAVGSIGWTLRSLAPASPRSLLTGGVAEAAGVPAAELTAAPRAGRGRLAAGALAAGGVALVAAAGGGLIGATGGFFGGGLLLLAASLALAWTWLHGAPAGHAAAGWSLRQVGFRNASYRPGRSVLCIALIAAATFIIVAVDAFRREGGGDPGDRRSGTGGYALLADTLLPIVHDPSTPEGRDDLFISDLFESGEPLDGVDLARFRVRPGEDASCLNLYQAKDPRILAPTAEFMADGRFSFGATAAQTPEEEANPWLLLNREFPDGAVPAIADATSLAYALHLGIGDDFVINRESGNPIRLRIVAALADSIFQRELLVAEHRFERLFPDYDGYRFFLIDAPPERAASASAALEDRLADFGVDAVSAPARLAAFHRVENTYLATFQTLGGLGLILGTVGLGAVLLRNVLERRRELALMRAVGYDGRHLSLMVLAENALLLLAGLAAGAGCAIVAIAPAWLERGGGVPLVSLGALLGAVVVTGFGASLAATVAAVRAPLLGALRTE